MTFGEQVWLEVIKGVFLTVVVGLGGFIASLALERYKRVQDVRAEVTKRQYSALLALFESLMTYEKKIMRKAFDSRAGRQGQGPDPEAERWMGEQLNEGEWAAVAQGLLLGPEVTKDALNFVQQAWGVASELTRWNMDLSKQEAELNATRERLMVRVPEMKRLRNRS